MGLYVRVDICLKGKGAGRVVWAAASDYAPEPPLYDA